MKKNMKFIVPCFVFVLILAGCQSFDGESTMVSAEGVKVEKLFPLRSFSVVKLGADSGDQLDALDELGKKFPQNPMQLLTDALRGEIDGGEVGLSYDDDIIPVIGAMPRIMFDFVIEDPAKDPEVMMAMITQDKTLAMELLEKMIADEKGTKENYKNYVIYSAKDGENFAALYKDVLVMAPEKALVTRALDLGDSNGKETLLLNSVYQKSVKDLKENVGFIFIDPAVIMNTVAVADMSGELSEEDRKEMEGLESMKDYIAMIEGELFAFRAEKEGLRVLVRIFGDEEKMKELNMPMGDQLLKSYLYKQLPGDDLMVYSESSNLKASLEVIEKMYSGMPEVRESISQMKLAFGMAGIDYEKDLLAMMDKGFAFSLYGGTDVIPRMGLFMDVSTNVDGAKKLLALIDSGLQMMVAQSAEQFGGVLSFGSDADGNKKLVVDMSLMPEELAVTMPAYVAVMKTEFNYGIKDDVMYLAFYPGLTDGGFSVVAENAPFKSAMANIPGYDKGVTFIDFGALMSYVDNVVAESGAEMPPEYMTFKDYMAPVKSMIMSSGDFENGLGEGEGFIRIE